MKFSQFILKAKNGATLPEYQTKGSSGADLVYAGEHDVVINSLDFIELSTNIFVQDYIKREIATELQIRSRSSMLIKGLVPGVGTIDSDYRGELSILLRNITNTEQIIRPGQRLAQLVCVPILQLDQLYVKDVQRTGGFGSTGSFYQGGKI